jgi:hypothetical protein
MTAVSLPVLAPTPGCPQRITPTDISQFVRLEQCERFLRFRLSERAGMRFMEEYHVTPQRITPLLSLSGKTFEEGVEGDLGGRFRSVHYAEKYGEAHDRPTNNADLLAEVAGLKPGKVVVVFQPRLEATLGSWFVRGDVDLIRLERHDDGLLYALIADMKSTTQAKVEHRLQVAFYHLMLARILADAGISDATIQTGILFRPPADPTTEEAVEVLPPLREAAEKWFGLKDVLLEVVADPDAYLRSVSDLVTGPESTALRVAQAAFADVPFALSFKCDGCLYNEFCMKDAAESEDLSLLPYMTGVEKEALRRAGVTTIQALASLKDFATPAPGTPGRKADLTPAPGQEAVVRRVAATWPVGPRLDELVHRAKSFRRSVKKDGTQALGYIPDKGNSTLPACRPDLNPNLVRVYIDAQHDYLNDRVYLLGALVVACKDGSPDPARRRTIVRLTDGPPETAAQEQQLFVDWTRELVKAVVELAAPGEKKDGKNTAPIHVVFYDRYEQRLLLEGLARNFPPILKSTPPLYDFLTQFAGFDSPVASFMSEEIREFKNYPMTCQSLQSVATYLKFDWNTPQKFRDTFKARMFDYLGKLDVDGTSEWYTRRSRFASSVPLEYAYGAWGQLPTPKPGRGDEFADYRGVTKDTIRAFQARRLDALEQVANAFPGNPNAAKTPFLLPDLAGYEDKAGSLAHALAEFVAIERHVAMSDWRGTRHVPPERRVLMGETLLVRYVEADQEPDVAEQNREHHRRQRKRAEAEAAHRAKYPDKPFRVPRGQGDEYKWSPEGLAVRLRVETVGVDCDLHEALALTTFREGDRLVLFPRWTVDERLPASERTEFTPTPKQLLYGNRAELKRVVATEKDVSGRVLAAVVAVELKESFGGEWSRGYVFPSISRPLDDGKLYTLDPCPNDWYGYWCSQVVQGLCRGEENRLYDLLNDPVAWGRDASGSLGQMKFLAGLLAFRDEGLLHDFEKSKRSFIGGYGKAPVLLVQGPPGTGKSYSTAFAIFARIQGAMQQGRPCRVFVSCKTHAATDVLVKNILDVQKKLRELRRQSMGLFDQYLDPGLLDVPLFRVAPRDPPPEGVTLLTKDAEKEKGELKNYDVLLEKQWEVVGVTPGGVYSMMKARFDKEMFGQELCDLLVLDEASQMNLPEAVMAALPLKADGQVVVVGDHRQMPPIVHHDWEREYRRTFRQYEVYTSLFDTLRQYNPPMIQFAESFRLHAAMADFLREEIYRHDGIAYFSQKRDLLPARSVPDEFVAAVLRPEYPLVVVVHDEAGSQVRNPFEQALIEPVIRVLADQGGYALDADEGLGIVVPHRAQRAALQQAFPALCVIDASTGLPAKSAIDTVERFQGGERTVILVSATESDRAYLLASSEFLLDPRRLTVALSRAKRKMALVASRTVFSLFSPDEDVFSNAQLWKNLLLRVCTTKLWEGERQGQRVAVWGRKSSVV